MSQCTCERIIATERNALIVAFIITAAFCSFCFGYWQGYQRGLPKQGASLNADKGGCSGTDLRSPDRHNPVPVAVGKACR